MSTVFKVYPDLPSQSCILKRKIWIAYLALLLSKHLFAQMRKVKYEALSALLLSNFFIQAWLAKSQTFGLIFSIGVEVAVAKEFGHWALPLECPMASPVPHVLHSHDSLWQLMSPSHVRQLALLSILLSSLFCLLFFDITCGLWVCGWIRSSSGLWICSYSFPSSN